ncbi:MAG: hypothetical protein WCF85_15205 [Rhodospirillaceae bacterium]
MSDILETIIKTGFFGSLAVFVVGVAAMRLSEPVWRAGGRLLIKRSFRGGVLVMRLSQPAWRWGGRLMMAGLTGMLLTLAVVFVLYQAGQVAAVVANYRMTTGQGIDWLPLILCGCLTIFALLLVFHLVRQWLGRASRLLLGLVWASLAVVVTVWWIGAFVCPPGWVFYIANPRDSGDVTVLETGSGEPVMVVAPGAVGTLVWRLRPPSGLRTIGSDGGIRDYPLVGTEAKGSRVLNTGPGALVFTWNRRIGHGKSGSSIYPQRTSVAGGDMAMIDAAAERVWYERDGSLR